MQNNAVMDQFAELDQELSGGEREPGVDSELDISAEKLDEIDALLSGQEPKKPDLEDKGDTDTKAKGDTPEAQGDAEDDTAPLTEDDDSVSDEIEAKSDDDGVDWDQEIPMPDGFENLSLSSLKDIATNAARSQAEVIEKENSMVEERDDISQLLDTLGQYIPRQALPQIKALGDRARLRESKLLLDAIPEWKDPVKKVADGDIMLKLVKTYGVTEKQFNSIDDHRMLKFIRDVSLDRLALETARERLVPSKKVKRQRPVRRALARKNATLEKTLIEAKASSSQNVKLAAIDQLIGN